MLLTATMAVSSQSTTNKMQRFTIYLFIYFCKTLYVFQTVFPSIIRSSKLHIQRQVFVRPIVLEHVWNVMAHAQKPDLVFQRNGRVHLNRRGRQFSRLLAAEVCASAVVMLDTPYSEAVWRVLATHSTRMFPLHFPYRASPCAIRFQLSR